MCRYHDPGVGHHTETPRYTIPFPLGRYTKTVTVGKDERCFKDFSNLAYVKWDSVGTFYRLEGPEDCLEVCQQTQNCVSFNYVTGIPYGHGCDLSKDNTVAEISPIYSGNISCPAEKEACITRDVSYEKRERIVPTKSSRRNNPYIGGNKTLGCQQYCQRNSGNKGFLFEEINWRLSDTRLKRAYPDGRVPCFYFTYMYLYLHKGFCLLFTKKAKLSIVVKIAGLTTKCRNERVTELREAIYDDDFHDTAGYFFNRNQYVGRLENIVNPKLCREACKNNDSCGKFQLVIGMPGYSGCYLFTKDAQYEEATVRSGQINCPPGMLECERDVEEDVTFGDRYEIVPKPDSQFNGAGIDDCEEYCRNRSGQIGWFRYLQLDWGKTGRAVNKYYYSYYRCHSWTYTDNPFFGRPCKIYIGGNATYSRRLRVYYRSDTESPRKRS